MASPNSIIPVIWEELHVDPIQYTSAWSHPTHHPRRQLNRFTHFHTTTPQSPYWLQRDAHLHTQNCHFPSTDLYSHLIIHPSTDPTHHSKRYPDPISRFSTVHPLHRKTDRWFRWQTCKKYPLMDYRDAANNTHCVPKQQKTQLLDITSANVSCRF